MKKLYHILEYFETILDKTEIENQNISSSSIGWHIEHTLVSIDLIVEALRKLPQTPYKPIHSFSKYYILITGRITRGRAKAPNFTLPKQFDKSELEKHIKETRKQIQSINEIPTHHYFTHPFFGPMNKFETKRILYIHSWHHVKIIKDVLK
jgi:hypothetical protein